MKRLLFVVLTFTTAAWAQVTGAQATQRNISVTRLDIYCSGFIGKPVPHTKFVGAGMNAPNTTRYTEGNFIFLRGSGYQPGTRVSVVRELQDPNRLSPMKGERQLLTKVDQMYGDIGYATVVEMRGTDTAVAQIEFSCDAVVPGDLVIPFAERPMIPTRPTSSFDLFPAAAPKLSGRIVAAREFDQFVASGHKVYLNVGADKGLKQGDYLLVVRGYKREDMDIADDVSFGATMADDSQKNAPRLPNSKLKELPRRVLGEAIVLSTQAGTATAMIINTLDEIHIGDRVELE
jgi:hypothetical protein